MNWFLIKIRKREMASLKSCKEVFAHFDAEKKGYLTKH